MLTLDEVKNVGFRRANFGGYKPEDVDNFIDDIQISYEKILSERENLIERVKILTEKIKIYEEEAKSIKGVIEKARGTAERALDEAETKTSEMLEKAKNQAEEILEETKKEVNLQKQLSEKLQSESQKLKQELEQIYKKHIQRLKEFPAPGAESEVTFDKNEDEKDILSFHGIDFESEKISGGVETCEKTSLCDQIESLKFGKNYDLSEDLSTPAQKKGGVYSGIFRKD